MTAFCYGQALGENIWRVMELTIRKIEPEEILSVYELLVQLARHEKIEDRLKLTPEKMQEELFGPKADWNCLVVSTSMNEIIGFCLFSFANINRSFNSTPLIHIDDFFIKSEYRKLGIGKQLLQSIAMIAFDRGIERIELWCLKDNDMGQSFYNKLGARKIDFLDIYQLNVTSLLEH